MTPQQAGQIAVMMGGISSERDISLRSGAAVLQALKARGFNAYVSPQHANFILHDGAATAADVEGLMQHMVAVVQAATGVSLQAEVRIVGEAMAEGRI